MTLVLYNSSFPWGSFISRDLMIQDVPVNSSHSLSLHPLMLLAVPVFPLISYASTKLFMGLCKPNVSIPATDEEEEEENEDEKVLYPRPYDPEETGTPAPFGLDEAEPVDISKWNPAFFYKTTATHIQSEGIRTSAYGQQSPPATLPTATQPTATQPTATQPTATQPPPTPFQPMDGLAIFEHDDLNYKITENSVNVKRDGNNYLFKRDANGLVAMGTLFASVIDAPAGKLVNLNGHVMPLSQFLEVVEITEYPDKRSLRGIDLSASESHTPPTADPVQKGGDFRHQLKVVAESVLCKTNKGRFFVIKGASVPLVIQALQTLA